MTIDSKEAERILENIHELNNDAYSIVLSLGKWMQFRIKKTMSSSMISIIKSMNELDIRRALINLLKKIYECNADYESDPNAIIFSFTNYVEIKNDGKRLYVINTRTHTSFHTQKEKVTELKDLSNSEFEMAQNFYMRVSAIMNTIEVNIKEIENCIIGRNHKVEKKIKLKVVKVQQIANTLAALSHAAASVFAKVNV